MKALLFLGTLLCFSILRVTNAQYRGADGLYAADDDDEARSSGSGQIIDEPTPGAIPYKRIEIKFSTKHAFQNSPSSNDFMAEVVEELLYALNSHGGPMPSVQHRPAITSRNEISRDGVDPTSATTDGSGGNLMKFRGYINVPQSIVFEEYLTRITKNKFFHNIRQLKGSDNQGPLILDENTLIKFETQRLPPRRNGGGETSIEQDPGKRGEDDESGVNKPTIVVEYKPLPKEFLKNPATLAAMIAGALAGLLCTILCTIFVVYRMRKKDEGSYALDEPSKKYKHEYYIASATKEFFA